MTKNLDELVGDLAYARVAAEELANTIVGSSEYHRLVTQLRLAFAALDKGHAFDVLDEHNGYEDAEDTLARIKEANAPRKDPAKWSDLTSYRRAVSAARGVTEWM